MVPTIYVASTNAGKLRDFATAATTEGVKLLALPGIEAIAPPPEDASTFEENATSKAVYYSRFAPGELVVADDSGLEVEALNGAPGVRSARYASDQSAAEQSSSAGAEETEQARVDLRNNLLLLKNLAAYPAERRAARYRCVLAAARDARLVASAEGSLEGLILTAPRGTEGFGYDPLFFLPALKRTMAEVDAETRMSLSHRGAALRALLQRLQPLC